jgi:hypothetical protein
MKKILLGLLVIGAAIFTMYSCEKTETTVAKQEVSFDLAGLPDQTLGKKSGIENDTIYENDSNYPACSQEAVDHVDIIIDDTTYTVGMTALSPSQTEVIQLEPGTHTLEAINVYDDNNNLIYIMPSNTSIEVTEAGLIGVPLQLDLKSWTKNKINVDVVCWHEYKHKVYTWGWTELKYYQMKHLCFFGDVCTKYYEDFGQNQYDFPATFTIDYTYTLNGNTISKSYTSNGVKPLCIDYLDDELNPENLTYTLSLETPTGPLVLDANVAVPEGAWSGDGSWAGDDGIYLFNVGKCGTNVDRQFAPYQPLPSTVTFKITGPIYNDGYIDLTIVDVPNDPTPDIYTGAKLPSWCIAKTRTIQRNTNYPADVYSSLYPENMPSSYSGLPWDKLNWILNNKDAYTPQEIQAAIWHYTDGDAATTLSDLADAQAGYIPPVGGYSIVILDPSDTDSIQILVVRIDP